MFYRFLKIIVRVAAGIYYRRIQVKGLENIPLNRPVLFTSNHPNAFMDAIVLTLFFPRRTYSLARSDVFDKAFKRKIMEYFRIMPIYRIQDGADQLHKNTEIFEKCHSLLNKKDAILIFPEGICVQERRLRKLRKGLARIAFGSMEVADFKMDLCIVPVGINYTKPAKRGGELFLNISPPIEVEHYIEQYKQDKVRAINKLTADVEAIMSKLIVVIENPKDDQLVSNLETMVEDQIVLNKNKELNPVENNFINSCKISSGISKFKQKDKLAFEEFESKAKNFFSILKKEGYKQELLQENVLNKNNLGVISLKSLLLLLTFPIFITGFFLNYIPYRLPYILSKKIVKNNIEFFSSINLTIGTLIFIFYYLLISVITAIVFSAAFIPLIIIIGSLTGKFALYYREIFQEVVITYKMKNNPVLTSTLLKDKIWINETLHYLIKGKAEIQLVSNNENKESVQK
ncbi:MAG: 1-acyl-sn-glycerol-3-phosphate acyltransferase [Bacteroidota bacterium]|nr:1-acyl-sn-glycerol-3-phosphate acyltransferase [Bacteroidota bacterium]